ncbi:transposase [Peribacillus asahii]|uniref:transposase n=1 Tax=Peribacillus asahii TaxID=228899 RepID=UPI00115E1B2F|nr:transposase [Peribacillus asahii]
MAIDDFVFQKDIHYGKLLCDLEIGKLLDLLPLRKQKDVTRWIQNHPTYNQ